MLGDPSFPQASLETPTPSNSGHIATSENTTLGDSLSEPSSNQSTYHTVFEVTYSNDRQLKELAMSLPNMLMDMAEKAI